MKKLKFEIDHRDSRDIKFTLYIVKENMEVFKLLGIFSFMISAFQFMFSSLLY